MHVYKDHLIGKISKKYGGINRVQVVGSNGQCLLAP